MDAQADELRSSWGCYPSWSFHVSVRRSKEGELSASAYDSRSANEFQVDQSCCPRHWHCSSGVAGSKPLKKLDVQAHVSYTQEEIAKGIMKIAKPSKDDAKNWLLLPVLEKMVNIDHPVTPRKKEKEIKDEIDLKFNSGIVEKIRDDEIAMSVLSEYVTLQRWENCWDLVVERLILLCTPRTDGKDATEESPQGKFLSVGKKINFENFLDLNYIDPFNWTKFKQMFALGELFSNLFSQKIIVYMHMSILHNISLFSSPDIFSSFFFFFFLFFFFNTHT